MLIVIVMFIILEAPNLPVRAKGSMGQLMEAMKKSPAKWISQESWLECQQLSDKIPAFSGICSHISNNPQYWLKFSNSSEPYKLLNEYTKDDPSLGTFLDFYTLYINH